MSVEITPGLLDAIARASARDLSRVFLNAQIGDHPELRAAVIDEIQHRGIALGDESLKVAPALSAVEPRTWS